MGIRIGSEEELESQRGEGFSLMGEDDYLLELVSISVKRQPDIYNKTEAEPGGKMRDVAMVKFNVISFANGETLYDKDGVDTDDRIFWDFLEVERIGMKPQPSKARKFFAACLGQPIGDAIAFDSYQDLVGARLIGHAVIKKNGKQGIDSYKPVRRGRPQGAATAPATPVSLPGESIAAATTVDVAAKAAEIFGEDAAF
jgi:hypothetical protein